MNTSESENKIITGDFHTPKAWADEAHKFVSSHLGEGWKDDFIVWDPAYGIGNLTADYEFSELFCSTLNQQDIDFTEDSGINVHGKKFDSVKFQFDFLNDDEFKKTPWTLVHHFKKNVPIVILMNPPYGTSNNSVSTYETKDERKKGIEKTNVNKEMHAEGLGKCAKNLYVQFLYKILKLKREYGLTQLYIASFTPISFLSGSDYEKFRKEFFKDFRFKAGFMLQAGHFSEVSQRWGIAFSIFEPLPADEKTYFEYEVKDINKKTGEIKTIQKKTVYNTDTLKPANEWMKAPIKHVIKADRPFLSSPLEVKTEGRSSISKDAMGAFICLGNSVYSNKTYTGIITSAWPGKNGFSITQDNFERVVTLFTAKKCIKPNWINQKDNYLVPDTSHPKWKQFFHDSIVYSLFHGHSYQSSLRSVYYYSKDRLSSDVFVYPVMYESIFNDFFWMSHDDMSRLAEEWNFTEMMKDLSLHNSERFVQSTFFGPDGIYSSLSQEAKDVLMMAKTLVSHSMPHRMFLHRTNPKYNLHAWDCGWAQLKLITEPYMPEEHKAFRKKFQEFEAKLLPFVYELGFLPQL